MKLIEKLAEDAIESKMDERRISGPVDYSKPVGIELYMAGFRKAREMAMELAYKSSPQTGDPVTDEQIRQIGEEEVPDGS